MKAFPTTYTSELETIDISRLTDVGQQAARKLADTGYEVMLGLTETAARQLHMLALEPSIMEYCPNDCGARFRDQAGTDNWLSKGRVVFLLIEKTTGAIAGYAWAGESHTDHVPDGKVTLALRLSEKYQGKGLATPYLALAVDATIQLFDADHLWLETWQSNAGAVHIYQKVGFTLVTSVPGERPTATGAIVPDVRLYMKL